jgi:hypothetical protein
VRAVDADGYGLGKRGDGCGALAEKLSVGYVFPVWTSEGKPRGEFRVWSECLADGFCFSERWECFEGENIRGLRWLRCGKHIDTLAMELDEIGEGAGVIAVIFGAVVESCAVWTEGSGDEDALVRKCGYDLAGERNCAEQGSISAGWIEGDFCIAHARNLVASGFDDVGSGLDVGAMDGCDFFRRFFEDMGGPQRAVDVGAEVFEFRGHATVEDPGVGKESVAV